MNNKIRVRLVGGKWTTVYVSQVEEPRQVTEEQADYPDYGDDIPGTTDFGLMHPKKTAR